MDLLSTNQLGGLDPALDLFEDTPDIDAALLAQGLHLPLPVSGGLLVWGFSLVRQAARIGIGRLAVRRLPPLPGAELLALALRLEGRPGALSWPEKENLLRFARAHGGSGGTGKAFDLAALSPLIEGHPDLQLETRIERFARLPAPIKAAVAGGRLDLRTGELAVGLPGEAVELIDGSPLSFSDRRRFLSMLLELYRRDGLAPEELPAMVRRLLESPEPVETLAGRRCPTLTALRRRFAALADTLWKGSSIRIDAPPCFEGDGFSVSFRFSSPDALDRQLQTLHRVAEHAHELFALLH